MDQSASQGDSHRFGAGGGFEFGEDTLEVDLHRLIRPADCDRDLLVALPLRHEAEYLQLPGRKPVALGMSCQVSRHRWRNHILAATDRTDSGDDLGHQHVLEQIATSPGIERTPDIAVALIC